MSYRTMLKHRITILRLVPAEVNGYPTMSWVTRYTNIPAWVDLNFIRKGKDPVWTPEAGRPGDRTGVLFLLPSQDIASGDRIKVTKGPIGTFQIEQAVDEAWRPSNRHHLEVGIIEVAKSVTGKEPKA